ncbi:MAG: hypothetical protein M3164_04170 [Actinomycetota bacterium]|nr:hypothetical protein [Actinomycetota bacterium]
MQQASDRLDELFSAPLEEFVKLRNRIAKELAATGSHQEAEAVRSLKKPTVAAWAMNQVARRDPHKVRALLDAHTKLREANSPEEFREASSERQEAVKSLLDAVSELLDREGHAVGGGANEKVTRTLLALASNEQAETAFSLGRLEKDLEPEELFFTASVAAPRRRGRSEADRELEEARHVARRLNSEADQLGRLASELEARAEAAEKALEEARRESERFRYKAGEARKRHLEKQAEAKAALDEVSTLEKRAAKKS